VIVAAEVVELTAFEAVTTSSEVATFVSPAFRTIVAEAATVSRAGAAVTVIVKVTAAAA